MVPTYVVAAILFTAPLFGSIEGQRKVSRPLPTETETKERERANFDCPEEFGYYPHPSDCTQYYVCVFGGALLESCTGGLMYSHELQTCDWPRNVGCDGLELAAGAPSALVSSSSASQRSRERSRDRESSEARVESRTKYSPQPPPPAQPKAVVTSRGQPRQLQSHTEIIKQQLYEVEESLPPAEEVESDRQQRVYRGQPSLVGQVQRDRDGYRHTNALPTYKDRGEKIGVISFGTQSQLQHYSTAPDIIEIMTNTLMTKRRRRRDAQRSRIVHKDPWHAVQRIMHIHQTANRQHIEHPRQKHIPVKYTNEDDFRPFVPNYALPSNIVGVQHPPPKSFQYFNPNSFSRPVTSATAHYYDYHAANEGKHGPSLKHTVEYNHYPVHNLDSAHSHVIPQISTHPIKTRSKDNVRGHTEALTQGYGPKQHSEASKEDQNSDNSDNRGKTEEENDNEKDKEDSNGDGHPKNSTVSYEYHSDEVDEDYEPPASFYNTKNKYEDIFNPFEDPHFDFDKFLEKLGSTTTTTTTTTTTPKPKTKVSHQSREATDNHNHKIAPNEPKRHNALSTEYSSKEDRTVRPATPSPNSVRPVKEDLDEDYSDEKDKKLYSSRIKPGTQPLLEKSTVSPEEYEYYYEEYDYQEPSNKNDVSKSNKTNSESVKYSAKYQDDDLHIKTSKVEFKTELPPRGQYLIESTITPTTRKVPTTKTVTSTEYSDNIFAQGQFLVETSSFTTSTPKSKKTVPVRKRTTVRPTQKPQKPKHKQTITEFYQHDMKQEQSRIINSEDKTQAPSASTATATERTLYNTSQYNNINQHDNRYDPYYALYDEDVELYKDVDYTPQNNNHNTNTGSRGTTSVYRGSPAVVREESTKRGNAVYNNNVNQDIYQQPSTVSDYSDNSYQDEDASYRQPSRTSSRGDRNEINEIEEVPATKRPSSTSTIRKPTTTTPRITTTTQARTLPPKKITTPASQTPVTAIENQTQALSNNTDPGHIVVLPNSSNILITTKNLRPLIDKTSDHTLHEPNAVTVKKPTPFEPFQQLTTEKPAFHFITQAPRSTHQISQDSDDDSDIQESRNSDADLKAQTPLRLKIIVPTTYAPPKYLLKSILPKTPLFSSPIFSFRPKNRTGNIQSHNKNQVKALKTVRKLINPITVNHELATSTGDTSYESAKNIVDHIDFDKSGELSYYLNGNSKRIQFLGVQLSSSLTKDGSTTTTPRISTTDYIPTTTAVSTTTTTTTTTTSTTRKPTTTERYNSDGKSSLYRLLAKEKIKQSNQDKKYRITVEVPPPRDYLDEDTQKPEPDQPPSYKPRPVDIKTDSPVNTSYPTRVSRVNAAIKSLIAIGTKDSSKCSDKGPKCKVEAKQRTPSRGRGTSQYSNSASIASNEVTVNVNRGTPPPRSRPTLKPSTSIVSKATEFIDIYKFPPRRPDALYPQPQPDKTAAKCRKDVCLLPDCSCGGKEIPGDIPVEQVPQIVLLTFDDSVNDLNKGLYQDLFERGRTNPNGCPIAATFYVSHEWTDYSQVQNLYSDGHELASHTVSHSFGEQFSQKKWTREVAGQREILSAYGGVKLEDVRGMRAPFLSVGGNKMFKMLYDSNFTYDSSMPIYENKPPSWPYTLDYKLFHDCMIPPCPTRSYPGVWEVPMVMWQDLNGGRCSMGDACSNPPESDGVFRMLLKNFERHYTTNRAPFGLFYHAAWFTQPHHKEGFINFIDTILAMKDVWLLTNWQALQWVRDPTPTSRLNSFQPFQCDYADRPKRCNNPKVCNLWHKSGVRYMRTCQPCPDIYPWTGNTGIRSSRIDNDIED